MATPDPDAPPDSPRPMPDWFAPPPLPPGVPEGPYLAAALFCQTLIREQDGPISAVRILNGVGIDLPESALNNAVVVGNSSVVALIAFNSGQYAGTRTLRLVQTAPDGQQRTIEAPIAFEADGNGSFYTINMNIDPKTQGLFTLDVYLDGAFHTRMPLLVKRQMVPGS